MVSSSGGSSGASSGAREGVASRRGRTGCCPAATVHYNFYSVRTNTLKLSTRMWRPSCPINASTFFFFSSNKEIIPKYVLKAHKKPFENAHPNGSVCLGTCAAGSVCVGGGRQGTLCPFPWWSLSLFVAGSAGLWGGRWRGGASRRAYADSPTQGPSPHTLARSLPSSRPLVPIPLVLLAPGTLHSPCQWSLFQASPSHGFNPLSSSFFVLSPFHSCCPLVGLTGSLS